ncbi:hypothetical protein IGI04_007138 [Brassica rapa subsp. trilocularis]|uniref:Uncharacterized protein n=1 Tax=Brassica rapa subsp. trilocularis TaxID=1813537 RepID=A0ABQ7NM30_BRACM|nr:hypothetical protein IGI04_007138 [Brassica rapa subsp. trilocularis]
MNSFTTIAPPYADALAITIDIASLFSIAEKIGEDLRTASEEIMRSVFLHAIVTDLQNKRQGTASTLTCGEVRGGRIKPRGRYMKVTTEFDPLRGGGRDRNLREAQGHIRLKPYLVLPLFKNSGV